MPTLDRHDNVFILDIGADENRFHPDWIASVDSMAFDFSARVKARQRGISNSVAHRSEEMTRWMDGALDRAAPTTGDQFRLSIAA